MISGLFNKFLLFSLSLHAIVFCVVGFSTSKVDKTTTFPVLINYIETKDQNVIDSRNSKPSVAKPLIKKPEDVQDKVAAEKKENTVPFKSDRPERLEAKNRSAVQSHIAKPEKGEIEATRVVATELAYPDYKINPKPEYPLIAQRRGIEGDVYLKVYVLDNGKVGELKLEKPSGSSLLDSSAVDAVRDWVFVPGKRNGEPVPGWVTVPVKYRLTKL